MHLLESLFSKSEEVTNIGGDVDKREYWYTAGEYVIDVYYEK